jgi:isovaleryl-CoA dehydrogenase
MLFDTHITDDTDALRDSVKRMCDAELAPRATAIDHDNHFPMDMWKKFGDLGLLGISVAEEYGGTGMGYLAHTVAMEEVSRASASVGLAYGAAMKRRRKSICRNYVPANSSAHSR